MRMNERSRDWLDLSAYIDGELNPREKEKFERRLQSDPQLRSELNQLKVTRSMIRSLPRRKVPRNFTLTPDMVPAPRKSLWLPVFSYASAASAVIVLVLLLVQFLPGGFLGKEAPTANQIAMSAEMDGYTETAAEQPQIIYWGGVAPQVMAEGKGGGGPSAPVYTQDNATTMMLPPDQTITSEQETLTGESAPETAADAPSEEMPAEPLQAQATPTAESGLTSPDSTDTLRQQPSPAAEEAAPQAGDEAVTQAYGGETQDNGPILGVKPDDQANQMTIPESSIPAISQQTATGQIPPWVTYLFTGLALITAAVAVYLWRKTH